MLSFLAAFVVAGCVMAVSYVVKYSDNSAQASAVMDVIVMSTASLRREVAFSPDTILDIKGRDVHKIFNTPELVRRDLPTVIWQYRNEACVLDVYFTAASADVMKAPVVHYEMRERAFEGGKVGDQKACANSLMSRGASFKLLNFSALYKPGA